MSWAALLLAAALLIGGGLHGHGSRAGLTAAEPRRRRRRPVRVIRWPRRPARRACGVPAFRDGGVDGRVGDRAVCAGRRWRGCSTGPPICWRWVPIRRRRGRISDRCTGCGGRPCRRTVAAGAAIGVVGSGAGARSCRAGRPVPPRSRHCGERSRRAGLGADRRAARPLLSAGVRVPGHRPRRRGLGR